MLSYQIKGKGKVDNDEDDDEEDDDEDSIDIDNDIVPVTRDSIMSNMNGHNSLLTSTSSNLEHMIKLPFSMNNPLLTQTRSRRNSKAANISSSNIYNSNYNNSSNNNSSNNNNSNNFSNQQQL